MALRELESAMASETEALVGNKTINYEAALTAVETPVVVVVSAAVDAVVAPELQPQREGLHSLNGSIPIQPRMELGFNTPVPTLRRTEFF